ncbi:hypothetical protein L873DRAFT_1464717 [Choiromyces venosus 120613-1]|uniref:Uncharacterized protein n=1 Tax=Choiromyces venosus 120613-1 TaxID=1336337 RepID=A0A3N4K505_9PEZI|nr:hypothetical protein L873DRAFT_1464717 [Choiromyces venosus 120613-1]
MEYHPLWLLQECLTLFINHREWKSLYGVRAFLSPYATAYFLRYRESHHSAGHFGGVHLLAQRSLCLVGVQLQLGRGSIPVRLNYGRIINYTERRVLVPRLV